MRVIVIELLKPFTWVILLLVIALIFKNRGKMIIARRLLIIASLVAIIFSMGPLPYFLISHLENKYSALKKLPDSIYKNSKKVDIMVLGGGATSDDKWPANSQLSYPSLERVTESVRLYQLLSECTIIFSGNTSRNVESIAATAAKTAQSLGIPDAAIAILPLPNNTQAEAQAYKKYRKDSTRILILVTDALHMPRAMKCFEKQGIYPVAAPANPIIKTEAGQSGINWFPSLSTLATCGGALKEYVGAFALDIK